MKESMGIFVYEEKFPVEKSLLLIADKISRKLPLRDQDIGKKAIVDSLKNCSTDALIDFEDQIKNMVKQGSRITLGLLEATLVGTRAFSGAKKPNRLDDIVDAISSSPNRAQKLIDTKYKKTKK